jgi:hypothetical protein
MTDPRDAIAELEVEIDALSRAAERCRKVIALSKMATGTGGVLLVLTLTGLVRLGPLALVLAITAVFGGFALFGSHQSTREQIAARIRAQKARRSALIDGMDLRSVGES